jgi:CelD/BcsL family acetyltransferase involved in cellulose biosynthesis
MISGQIGCSVSPTVSSLVRSERNCSFALEVKDAATSIYEIDPLCDPRWDQLVDNHSEASVFHSTNWLRALRGAYDYEPVVLTTSPPGVALSNGLVFCRIKSWLTGRRLVSLPFSDHCEPLVSDPNELEDLLAQAKRAVDRGEWKYIEIRPNAIEPSSNTRFTRSLTYCSHSVDLRRSTGEVFASFHKDCVQRKIRRAERENLKYEEGTSDDLLLKFYRLLVQTRRRHSLPPQPMDWFKSLVASFGRQLKIRVASRNDLPIASIVTLSHNRTITYKYGCSDARFHKLGGIALLFWRTIQEAKANGFDELDLGRSEPDNVGLVAFKESWGAAKTELAYWQYPDGIQAHPGKWQRKLVRSVVSMSPDVALKAVGNLLYRHIG